jgi:hypothetical protein
MTKLAPDLLGDNPSSKDWTFEIHDEMGRIILSKKIGDLVQILESA